MSNRDTYYDLLKGIAILLVIIGHSLQFFYPDYKSNVFFLTIYSFHMPLFIFISGIFFLSSVKRLSLWVFLQKRYKRLYVPSLFWGVYSVLYSCLIQLIKGEVVCVPNFLLTIFTGMWFLTVLFVLSVFGAFIEWKFSRFRYWSWTVLFIIVNVVPSFFIQNELIALMPFFVLSILLRNIDWKHLPVWVGFASTLLFILIIPYFSYEDTMYEMTHEYLTLSYYLIAAKRFLLGLCGTISVIWLCRYMTCMGHLSKCLVCYGGMTLPIYVLHQKFMVPNYYIKYHTTNILFYFCLVLCLLFASKYLYYFLRRYKVINSLLFGN